MARIEAAASQPAPAGVPQAQHDRLRAEASEALAQIDRLIGSLQA